MVPVPVPMPMPMPNAALVLCFFITAVWPSDEISSGSWTFNEKTVCQWIGQTLSVDNSYSRAELFTNNGSLLLKLVNKYDSGEYQVNMVPTKGSQTSATITLQVTENHTGGKSPEGSQHTLETSASSSGQQS
ncbi:uncharacterized protein LOC134345912 isoform X3 [Mobula hypostoma]|uniref:uncharacterized protein LOC134345912 isoform X3 n=1 Tax=Mobula hypostoma TaxID=723540 RepID=UPI002FC31AD7